VFNFFFLATSQFDSPITKKMKPWKLSEIEGSVLKYKVHPFWRSYIGECRTTFAKRYGIKVRCYEEHVEEHIGNLRNILGTHWELEGNLVGTHWEPRKNEKKSSPPSPPPKKKLKRKKSKAPWGDARAFSLAAWNFSSQKSLSPFSAWANTPCKEHPTH